MSNLTTEPIVEDEIFFEGDPGITQKFQEFIETINNLTVQISTHVFVSDHIYGSPQFEQQGAYSALNRVDDYIYNLPQLPNTVNEYRDFLLNLITFLDNLHFTQGVCNHSLWGGEETPMRFTANSSFDAMRLKVRLEARKRLILLKSEL